MIRARLDPTLLTLDVEGPATMMESAAVKQTASEHVSRGRALRVDLRDCTTMDSTFSGTLLSLKRQLESAGRRLTLVSPSAKVLELLRQMGLEDFYAIDVAERPSGTWQELTQARPEDERLRRLVLEAHDELACVPGPNAGAFRTVVDELRREQESGHPRRAGA
jgi:anti-anti-sigma factor